MSLPTADRIPYLDGLRGVAIISVILVHANGYFGGHFPLEAGSKLLALVLGSGWIGVNLFFVLSGFLITLSLLDAKASAAPMHHFYVRRALRILPLYFAFILLVSLPTLLGHHLPFLVPVSADDVASLGLFYYNFRVALFTHGNLANIHHFWSLCVEEHFYLVWPLVVLICPQRHLLRVCAGGIALSVAARIAVVAGQQWELIAYYASPCQLDGLLAGAFVATAMRSAISRQVLFRGTRAITQIASITLMLLILMQGHLNIVEGPGTSIALTLIVGILASSLIFAGLLAGLTIGEYAGLRSCLESSLLRTIGRYSYGIYVFHLLVLNISNTLIEMLLPAALRGSDLFAKPALAVTTVAVSLVLAILSYHYFERYFLRLKDRFVCTTRPFGGPAKEMSTQPVTAAIRAG